MIIVNPYVSYIHEYSIMPSPPSTVSSDDSLVDTSTALTTPDDSPTFSPVLRASRLHDGLDDSNTFAVKSSSLDATLDSPSHRIKNICCIGAGYVGKLARPPEY